MAKIHMIVKVQRPIVTSDPDPKVLIYNQDHSVLTEQPITEKVFGLFDEHEFKIYMEATWDSVSGLLYLGKRVRNPGW